MGVRWIGYDPRIGHETPRGMPPPAFPSSNRDSCGRRFHVQDRTRRHDAHSSSFHPWMGCRVWSASRSLSSLTPGRINVLLWASGAQFGFRANRPSPRRHRARHRIDGPHRRRWSRTPDHDLSTDRVVMKVAGSIYLLYLGSDRRCPGPRRRDVSRPLTLLQAAAFQAINPKAWIFALGRSRHSGRGIHPTSSS